MNKQAVTAEGLPVQSRRVGWLTAGVVAGPPFAAASFVQIPFRDGFDMTLNAFSWLLLGSGGWVQAINFVVAGLLYVLSGLGPGIALGARSGIWA
jgi:hypothetical protein